MTHLVQVTLLSNWEIIHVLTVIIREAIQPEIGQW